LTHWAFSSGGQSRWRGIAGGVLCLWLVAMWTCPKSPRHRAPPGRILTLYGAGRSGESLRGPAQICARFAGAFGPIYECPVFSVSCPVHNRIDTTSGTSFSLSFRA
jgi:hypothetical protein